MTTIITIKFRRRSKQWAICAVLTLGLSSGCVVTPSPAYPPYLVAPYAPPAPQVEVIGIAPGPSHFWISGFWGWGGTGYSWHPGYWQTPRPGYSWQPHHWEPAGPHWRSQAGHWRPHR